MRSLPQDLLQSLRTPEFWAYSSWLDIVTRYRRARIGLLWVLLPPLVFVLALGNLYANLMGYDVHVFLPYMGMGYALWRYILLVVNDATTVMQQHKAFIMDGRTRLTDYLLRTVAKGGFYFLFALVVMLGIVIWGTGFHPLALASLLVTIPVFLLNMIWLSTVIALIGARLVDIREAVGTVLILGFLLTPIIWFPTRAPPDTWYGLVVRLNPAYHWLEVVRAPLLNSRPETISLVFVAVGTVLGFVIATLMYRRYARSVSLWI